MSQSRANIPFFESIANNKYHEENIYLKLEINFDDFPIYTVYVLPLSCSVHSCYYRFFYSNSILCFQVALYFVIFSAMAVRRYENASEHSSTLLVSVANKMACFAFKIIFYYSGDFFVNSIFSS